MMLHLNADNLLDVLSDDLAEIILEPVSLDLLLDLAIDVDGWAPDYRPHPDHDTTSARIDYLRPGARSIGAARLEWMMEPLMAQMGSRTKYDFDLGILGTDQSDNSERGCD